MRNRGRGAKGGGAAALNLSAGDAVPVEECIARIAAAAGVLPERAEACLRIALEAGTRTYTSASAAGSAAAAAGDELPDEEAWSRAVPAPSLVQLFDRTKSALEPNPFKLAVGLFFQPSPEQAAACAEEPDSPSSMLWQPAEILLSCRQSTLVRELDVHPHGQPADDRGRPQSKNAHMVQPYPHHSVYSGAQPDPVEAVLSNEELVVECGGVCFHTPFEPKNDREACSDPMTSEVLQAAAQRASPGAHLFLSYRLLYCVPDDPKSPLRPCALWPGSGLAAPRGGRTLVSWTFGRQELLALPDVRAGLHVLSRDRYFDNGVWRLYGIQPIKHEEAHHLAMHGAPRLRAFALARVAFIDAKDPNWKTVSAKSAAQAHIGVGELRIHVPAQTVLAAAPLRPLPASASAVPCSHAPAACCVYCRIGNDAKSISRSACLSGPSMMPLQRRGDAVVLQEASGLVPAGSRPLDPIAVATLRQATQAAFESSRASLLASAQDATEAVERALGSLQNLERQARGALVQVLKSLRTIRCEWDDDESRLEASVRLWPTICPDILFSCTACAATSPELRPRDGALQPLAEAVGRFGGRADVEPRTLWRIMHVAARRALQQFAAEGAGGKHPAAALEDLYEYHVEKVAGSALDELQRALESWDGCGGSPQGGRIDDAGVAVYMLAGLGGPGQHQTTPERVAAVKGGLGSVGAGQVYEHAEACHTVLEVVLLAHRELRRLAWAQRLAAAAAIGIGERRALEAASRAALSHAWATAQVERAAAQHEAALLELAKKEEEVANAAKAKEAAKAAAAQHRRQEQMQKAAAEKQRREEEAARKREAEETARRQQEAARQQQREEAERQRRQEEAERRRRGEEEAERRRVAELESRRQQEAERGRPQPAVQQQQQRTEKRERPVQPATEARPAQANGTGASAAASPVAAQANGGEASGSGSDSEALEAAKAELEQLQASIQHQRKTTFIIRNEIEKERRRAAERAQAAAPAPRPPGASVAAKTGGRLCYAFARGQCLNPECPFEHPEGAGGRRQEPSPALAELQRELEAAQAEEAAAGRSLEALSASSQRLRDELGRARAAVGEAESAAAAAERRAAESCARLSSAAGGAEARRAAAVALEAQAAAAKEAAGAAERECAERGRVVGALECAARLQRQRPAASSDARRSGDAEAVRQLPPEAVARLAARLRAALEVHARGSNPHR